MELNELLVYAITFVFVMIFISSKRKGKTRQGLKRKLCKCFENPAIADAVDKALSEYYEDLIEKSIRSYKEKKIRKPNSIYEVWLGSKFSVFNTGINIGKDLFSYNHKFISFEELGFNDLRTKAEQKALWRILTVCYKQKWSKDDSLLFSGYTNTGYWKNYVKKKIKDIYDGK